MSEGRVTVDLVQQSGYRFEARFDNPAIPPLVKQGARRRPFHRQPTKNKRPGSESQILGRRFPCGADQLHRLSLTELLLRNDEFRVLLPKERPGPLHAASCCGL